jgi:ketosteroid isomerase-like protein
MTHPNHQLVRDFFAALGTGNVPDTLLTPDMTAWTTSSGTAPRQKYQGGVKLLQSLFDGGLAYTIDSLSAEGDRVAAEVQSRGRLVNGQEFHNIYVFMFRIRDGRIAAVAEHFNPDPVREKLGPLIQAAMAKAGKTL